MLWLKLAILHPDVLVMSWEEYEKFNNYILIKVRKFHFSIGISGKGIID
jgi:hypothetical protein